MIGCELAAEVGGESAIRHLKPIRVGTPDPEERAVTNSSPLPNRANGLIFTYSAYIFMHYA
jgi:hypothetical protein